MTYVIYKDADGKIKAVYCNCDTAIPLEGCTREETEEPQQIDPMYAPPKKQVETLDDKIKRLVAEQVEILYASRS